MWCLANERRKNESIFWAHLCPPAFSTSPHLLSLELLAAFDAELIGLLGAAVKGKPASIALPTHP